MYKEVNSFFLTTKLIFVIFYRYLHINIIVLVIFLCNIDVWQNDKSISKINYENWKHFYNMFCVWNVCALKVFLQYMYSVRSVNIKYKYFDYVNFSRYLVYHKFKPKLLNKLCFFTTKSQRIRHKLVLNG